MYLLTGASGFLGQHISKELILNNILFKPVSRKIDSEYYFDFLTGDFKYSNLNIKLNTIIHAAGKAHTSVHNDSQLFFEINTFGTLKFLDSLLQNKLIPEKFIFISSVSVYGLSEGTEITELSACKAKDSYGLSKRQAEEIIEAWCKKYNVKYYILRLPLIVGNNPPGNLGAMIKGLRSGRYVTIGKGDARKSMILAEDLAKFILKLNGPSGIYNLTDGYHPKFIELEKKIVNDLNTRRPVRIPYFIAKFIAILGDFSGGIIPINTIRLHKITSTLTFCDDKAKNLIGWNPRQVIKHWDLNKS